MSTPPALYPSATKTAPKSATIAPTDAPTDEDPASGAKQGVFKSTPGDESSTVPYIIVAFLVAILFALCICSYRQKTLLYTAIR